MKSINEMAKEWAKDKPKAIGEMLEKFPPGSRINVDGVIHHLIGFTEDGGLLVSEIDPFEDYDGAVANYRYICAHCLEDAEPSCA